MRVIEQPFWGALFLAGFIVEWGLQLLDWKRLKKRENTLTYWIARRKLSLSATVIRLLWYGLLLNGLPFHEKSLGLLELLLVVYIWGGFSWIVGLSVSAVSVFGIETRYGFNRATPIRFLVDRLKPLIFDGLLVGLSLTGAWFLWGALDDVFFLVVPFLAWVFLALSTFLFPVIFLPLTRKMTPLADGPLRERLLLLLSRAGVPIASLYVIDASKRSSHTNAFVCGFGPWKRIVLYDTLIQSHNFEEIEAIVAHELGHDTLGHVRNSLWWSIPGLFFASSMSFLYWKSPFVSDKADFLLQMIFLAPAVQWMVTPFVNFLSRRREFAADAWAARTIGKPEVFGSALERLVEQNRFDPDPHPWLQAFYGTHPTIAQRIQFLYLTQSPKSH